MVAIIVVSIVVVTIILSHINVNGNIYITHIEIIRLSTETMKSFKIDCTFHIRLQRRIVEVGWPYCVLVPYLVFDLPPRYPTNMKHRKNYKRI